MNGSPITSWDGVGVYFTFANSPGTMMLFLILAILVCVGAIIYGGIHESEAYHENMPE